MPLARLSAYPMTFALLKLQGNHFCPYHLRLSITVAESVAMKFVHAEFQANGYFGAFSGHKQTTLKPHSKANKKSTQFDSVWCLVYFHLARGASKFLANQRMYCNLPALIKYCTMRAKERYIQWFFFGALLIRSHCTAFHCCVFAVFLCKRRKKAAHILFFFSSCTHHFSLR